MPSRITALRLWTISECATQRPCRRALREGRKKRHPPKSRSGQDSEGPAQSTRKDNRRLRGESVPASEKVVSIFEPHTDIIKKARRETHYGHKVTLSTGKSGLVLDVVVEQGNPADSNLALRSVQRHAELFGKAPKLVVFDGGFASKQNLADIKAAGSIEVCFSKAPGVPMEQMTSTPRIRNILKKFRAGIEAGISFLKRSFGWDRVTWSGWPHFQSYVWASTVAHNLLTVARALIAKQSPA